jgi:hypothetical protein
MNSIATIENGIARLKWLAAVTRFEIALLRHGWALKAGYDPSQPRNELGRWTDTDGAHSPAGSLTDTIESEPVSPDNMLNGLSAAMTRLAQIIRVCTLSGVARTTDVFGNQTFSATYECVGGRTLTRGGIGHVVPGLVRDPFK